MKTALNPNTIQKTDLEVQMDVCAESGYEGFELMCDAVESYLDAGHDLSDIKLRLLDNGVAVAAVFGGNPFWPMRRASEESLTLERFRKYCKYCNQLGCEIITVNSMDDVSAEIAAEEMKTLCRIAQSHGVRIAYEPLGFAPQFKDIASTLRLLDQVEAENCGILLDPFHLHRGGSSFADIDLIPDDKLFLVHFDDVVNVPLDKMTDFDRVFPGDGILDLNMFIAKLRKHSYGGFVSVEIFNNDYWKRDPYAVAKEAKKRLDEFIRKGERM